MAKPLLSGRQITVTFIMAPLPAGCLRIMVYMLPGGSTRIINWLGRRSLGTVVGLTFFTVMAIHARCIRRGGRLLVGVVRHCFSLRVLLGSWYEADDGVWSCSKSAVGISGCDGSGAGFVWGGNVRLK
ncbi:hypothetical protein F5883DRAFT_536714 [Diaporthe sp. PMI_573]|nr:hypothetical protein F5883DRAFT_536714 [Diaporthaceae sp. PMI_573]